MRIALGSSRAAKVAAVRAAAARVASIDARWGDAAIIACDVETDAPAMPLTDEDLMRGAMARALAVQALLSKDGAGADLYLGLEGGFHSAEVQGERLTFLKGWAYVTDGSRGSFGASPSIIVPEVLVHAVVEGGRELAEVIDETAGSTMCAAVRAPGRAFPRSIHAGDELRSGSGSRFRAVLQYRTLPLVRVAPITSLRSSSFGRTV